MFKIISQQINLFSFLVQKSFMKEGAGKVEVKDSKEAIAKALELAKSYENDRAFREKISQDVKLKKEYENALKTLSENIKNPSFIEQANLIKAYLKDPNSVLNSKDAFNKFQAAKLDLIENFSNTGNDKPKEKVTLKEVSHEIKVKSIDEVRKQFDLATSKITSKIEEGKTLTFDESQKLKEAISLAEKQITEIEKTTNQKDKAYNDIKKNASDLKIDLVNAKKAAGEYTQESTNMKDREFSGVFSSFSRSEYINQLDSNSKESLDKILQSKDFLKIQQEISKELYSGKYKNSDGGISLTPMNNGKLNNILTSFGYKFSDVWKSKEIMSIALTLQDYAESQKNIPNLSSKEKIKLLLDFDDNGLLTKDLNFKIGELQSSNLLENDEKIDILLENLGFGNMQSFTKSMSENLALSKERFERSLGSMISSGVALSQLSVKNGVNKAFSEKFKDEDILAGDISSEIENSKKLDEKLEKAGLDEKQKSEAKKIIKLEAIGAVVGSKTGAGASFDIKSSTHNIIDSVGFGMIGNTPGITFSKEIYNKHGVKLNIADANIVIPMASLSYTLERNIKTKELFSKTIDSRYETTIYGSMTTLGSALGVNIERVSADTKKGVDKMVGEMEKKLLTIKGDLLAGNTFENSKFAKNSTDKVADESVYNDLLNSFKPLIGTSDAQNSLNNMLVGYKDYYQNYLFKNAEGLHITSAGGGVALVAGFLPIPFLTLGGEHNSINRSTVNKNLTEQLNTTSEESNLAKEFGLNFEKLDGKNVYSIIDKGNINFSSPSGIVEVQRKDGKIYFSGNINDISINKYFGQDHKEISVMINGGKTDGNGKVITSKEIQITTSVSKDILHSTLIDNKNLSEINKDALEKSKIAREDLYNIIQITGIRKDPLDALESSNTPKLKKLQDEIFTLSKNEKNSNLDKVWSDFKDLINNPKFELYAKSTNSTQNLEQLKQILSSIENNSEVKMIILKSLSQTLMKKGSLKNINGNVQLGNTIEKHETKKRDEFFHRVFNNETPDIINDITVAKNTWYKNNGDKNKYNLVSAEQIKELDGSIAFSATQTSSKKEGLIPFTGAYNIADAGNSIIEINAKSQDLINKLPESYLNSIRENLLKEHNLKISSNQEVKDMLNGKEVNGNKMDYKLAFVKMGECLNEAILLKDLSINSKKVVVNNLSTTTQSSENIQENNSINIGVAGALEKHEKHHDNNKTTPKDDGTKTEPIDEDTTQGTPEIKPVETGDATTATPSIPPVGSENLGGNTTIITGNGENSQIPTGTPIEVSEDFN